MTLKFPGHSNRCAFQRTCRPLPAVTTRAVEPWGSVTSVTSSELELKRLATGLSAPAGPRSTREESRMSRNRQVIVGVDTHSATHCAAVIDRQGRSLACAEFPASAAGYRCLLGWARRLGQLEAVGVEGSGAYGAGLARYLAHEGVHVLEVPRPDRRLRRSQGKSDPIDAEAAARAVLSGRAVVATKLADGPIEAVRNLRLARQGAVKSRTAAINTLRAMAVTAPEPLRAQLPSGGLPNKIIGACARLRPDVDDLQDPIQATKAALRSVAVRAKALNEEVRSLDRQLTRLVAAVAPLTSAEVPQI